MPPKYSPWYTASWERKSRRQLYNRRFSRFQNKYVLSMNPKQRKSFHKYFDYLCKKYRTDPKLTWERMVNTFNRSDMTLDEAAERWTSQADSS